MPWRPRNAELRRLLKRLPLAIAIAILAWLALQPVYNPALCWVTQGVARLLEYPQATQVIAEGDHATIGRLDLRSDTARLRVSLTQIHSNLVAFLGLVFALPRAFAGRGWKRFFAALGILALSHVLGLLWQVKCFYAFQLGAWSRAYYSDFARNFYGFMRYFFSLPVTFALPLLVWIGAYHDRVFGLLGMSEEPAAPKR